MPGPDSNRPDPTIQSFKDDAGRLIETHGRRIILGSILVLVLGMVAISRGCDQSKQAQIQKAQQNAKKYNTAPGLPQASTINGQKLSLAQQEAADRVSRQQANAQQQALTASQVECISKLPGGLPEAQFEALKALYCPGLSPAGANNAASTTSGAYNNPTPYPPGGTPPNTAPAESKKSLAQEAAEARKRRALAAYTAPPSDEEAGSNAAPGKSSAERGTEGLENASYAPSESPAKADVPAKEVLPVTPPKPEPKTEEQAALKNRPTSCLGLCEGRIIQALLVNTLNGDFVGPVIVQVDVPLVDFATNEIILPAGAVAFGESHAVTGFRQSRLAITFHKIQLRDGRLIYLDSKEPGLSQEGEVGLKDKVNNHWLQTFGVATVVGAIGALAQTGNSTTGFGYDPSVSIRNGITQQLGSTSDRILDKFLNIPPSIKERHGLRVALYIMGDIPGWSRRLERSSIN